MTAGARIDAYEWSGGREAMLRFGPENGPMVVVAPPLFEEANRTRALIVAVLRGLGERGIAGALPDLPGQGESVIATSDARLADWRDAFAAAVRQAGARCHGWAVRGGALVDGEALLAGRLHLSPEPGRSLVRDLLRSRRAAALAAGEKPPDDDPDRPGPPLLLAGNLIDRDLLRALVLAEPSRADRVVTISPDEARAHRALAPPVDGDGDRPRFRKPWVASEPFADARLVVVLTDEVAEWVRACAAA